MSYPNPAAQAARSKYVSNAVDAMSPGRVIVALYDRMLLDLERAAQALAEGAHETVHDCLVHAQAILAELHDSLDCERWPAGRALGDIYLFVYNELITANVEKDAARITSCRKLITPLRDAWVQAAGIVPTGAGGNA
ncbi:MAG TPA: flagellar export chaperone FliS [Acidimicrobiia bacterium]|nr:flagellar export chaperone FliS [Acidimicrobiia bacterium]